MEAWVGHKLPDSAFVGLNLLSDAETENVGSKSLHLAPRLCRKVLKILHQKSNAVITAYSRTMTLSKLVTWVCKAVSKLSLGGIVFRL